jgi:hypothetical protein
VAESDPPRKTPPAIASKAARSATVRFRVQPFDCKVTVDGELRRTSGGSDRYEVRLGAGDHRIRVEDPTSGQYREIWVRGLREAEERILRGGICLGDGCPTTAPAGSQAAPGAEGGR